ncbi:hypothetical protein V8C40DRAFT_239091 [Trichoderma camerunense]
MSTSQPQRAVAGPDKGIMSRDVLANISFIQDDPELFHKEKPYMSLLPDDGSFPITNCVFASDQPTPIHDMRPRISELRLDDHGFIIVENPLRFHGVAHAVGQSDPPAHLIEYLADVTNIVKDITGAEKAYCIDWRFRKASRQDVIDGFEDEDPKRHSYTHPAYKAHADLSLDGGWLTLRAYLSETEREEVDGRKRRARVINCWRPLVPQVNDCPLAFCRRSTVLDEDCIPYDRVDGSIGSEGTFLKPSTRHEWNWISGQTCDEVCIFQSWDSLAADFTSLTFHAAFWNPNWDGKGLQRESIETRIIVLDAL